MKSLNVIKAIALNTYRETVRDRVLYAIFIFALLSTLAGLIFGSLSVEQDIRILEDFGLLAITIFGGIIAMFVGTSLVFKEIDKRTIYLILSKPIARGEFVAGKFLGLSFCLFITNFAMGLFLQGLITCQTGSFNSFSFLFNSLCLVYVELLLVIGLATFFSTFSTPLMSMVFTLAIWVCAHLSKSLLNLGKMSASTLTTQITQVLYYCLPDLSSLTQIRGELMEGKIPSFSLLSFVLAYVIGYVILLLSLATVITENKEFN